MGSLLLPILEVSPYNLEKKCQNLEKWWINYCNALNSHIKLWY